jgi:hypothetical protein
MAADERREKRFRGFLCVGLRSVCVRLRSRF